MNTPSHTKKELSQQFKKYAFFFALAPAPMLYASYLIGMQFDLLNIMAYLLVAFAFVFFPLLDLMIGEDKETGSHDWHEHGLFYDFIIYLSPLVQIVTVIWACSVFEEFSTAGQIGWILSTGSAGTIFAVNIAHELMHRREKFGRFLGGLIYSVILYPGVKIRHARQHHPHVGTADDPGTSRFNQTTYQFIASVYLTSIPTAWTLAAYRKKKTGAPLWWLLNEMVGWLVLCALFVVSAYLYFGISGVIFIFFQGLVGAFILEAVNYTTHYGLLRQKLPNGKYEPATRMHAWDHNSFLINALLINAQRHGDHHEAPAVPYQSLIFHRDNPHLPGSYFGMALVAFIPPLWRKIMHPRLYEFYKSQGIDYDQLRASVQQ
ncbi:alkane 1-monooxygenase [Aliikangiella maris]|uniref:Alkane 1-monooxygenase n=2 Tax=Aliikangiella maris TaxID=3162458 RepID=A0ABV3MIX7_9GAMM